MKPPHISFSMILAAMWVYCSTHKELGDTGVYNPFTKWDAPKWNSFILIAKKRRHAK